MRNVSQCFLLKNTEAFMDFFRTAKSTNYSKTFLSYFYVKILLQLAKRFSAAQSQTNSESFEKIGNLIFHEMDIAFRLLHN